LKCSLAAALFLSIRGFIDMDTETLVSVITQLMNSVEEQEHFALKARDAYESCSPGWETWESQRQHMCGQKLAYQSAIKVIKELS